MRQMLASVGLGFCLFVTDHAVAQSAGTPPPSSNIAVQPMTTVDASAGTGYFQDPYPIHTASPEISPRLPTFAGTNRQLLSCGGGMRPGCFTASPIMLDPGPFADEAAAAGVNLHNFENLNIFQDHAGGWQMAVTAHVKKVGGTGSGWNVILHAHPVGPGQGVPTSWVADTLLVGELTKPAPDNYDGKYFQDGGVLYLVYNKKVGEGQDAVVAQAMTSPVQKAEGRPVPLLGPELANGGYNSELAFGLNQPKKVKLIETGNITRIDGKYVMTYSVGTYNRPDYKAGIAWSDSFLPPSGTYYRRIEMPDKGGIWGQVDHPEVLYLLQSQKPAWPHYVGGQVLAPGVPAIIRDANQQYFLTFAGYDPADAPTDDKGLYKGAHRRPYFVRLNVHVPQGARVGKASAAELAKWIEPEGAP